MSEVKPWNNKVAVVTGGASGIGLATATELSKRGATVIVLDKATATSNDLLSVRCDVSASSEVDAAAARVGKEFGRVAVLVNSAGIQRYGTGVTTTDAMWDEVMAVNLKSMFLMFRAFFPLMKDTGAAVVNVSSVQALGALPNSVAYVTSKHAVAGLTRALAIDHAVDNIRVNCVLPGSVDTPMLHASIPGAKGRGGVLKDIGELHALNRIANAKEVAKVILFLCSDDASFVTGGLYTVDGGMTALVAGKPPVKS